MWKDQLTNTSADTSADNRLGWLLKTYHNNVAVTMINF